MLKTHRMRNIVLLHKGWLCMVILSDIGVMLEELAKAYLLQNILDTAVAGNISGFYRDAIYTIFFILLMLIVFAFQDFCKNHFTESCMISIKQKWFTDIQKNNFAIIMYRNIQAIYHGLLQIYKCWKMII